MTTELFDTWNRHLIGFDPANIFKNEALKYPPHNIVQHTPEHIQLTLAVAGFAEKDITVTVHEGVLTINGSIGNETNTGKFLYHGLSLRDFNRQFTLDRHIHVVKATLENGLLVIDLERKIPETMKPKVIPVTRTLSIRTPLKTEG